MIASLLQVVRAQYPVNQWLVFTSDRTGQFDLYMVRLDGAELHPLAAHPQRDSHPNWSLNGAWIVFESNRNQNWDIFRVRPNGQSLKQLTTSFNIERWPYWDEDSTIIYKQNYQANSYLFVRIHTDGTPSSNHSPIVENVNVTFSPDNQYLVRQVFRNYHFMFELENLQTGIISQLTQHNGNDKNPSWSPDGQWLAYESDQDGNWEIYVMRRDGTDLRRLTQHPAEDRDPSWSPDLSKSWHPFGLIVSDVFLVLGLLLSLARNDWSPFLEKRVRQRLLQKLGKVFFF